MANTDPNYKSMKTVKEIGKQTFHNKSMRTVTNIKDLYNNF